MAYTATGGVFSQKYPGSPKGFMGYVGTQNDKALDAITLYTKLLTDMPVHRDNLSSIKSYLLQGYLTGLPDARNLSNSIAEWKLQGFDDAPSKMYVPQVKSLTYDDIFNYYEKSVKGRPIIIGVICNPKNISAKDLAKFGKVITISEKNLYNQEGNLF